MGMRLNVMTSFNYLRSPRPSWFANIALCGALIAAALTGFVAHASWNIGSTSLRAESTIQRQTLTSSHHHHAATFRIVRRSGGQSGFERKSAAPIPQRLAPRHSIVKALPSTPQPRLTVSATAGAVSRVKRRVRISVLGIVTGSRSSALVLLGGKTRVVTVGDLIGGERVTEIRNGRIALSNRQILALGDVSK